MARLKLNNITKIVVQFSPYRPGSASARCGERLAHAHGRRQQALRLLPGTASVAGVAARSFLATVLTDKVRATNPKCEITPVIASGDVPPQVEIVYGARGMQAFATGARERRSPRLPCRFVGGRHAADGQKQRMLTETLKVKEMMAEISYNNSRFPETDDLNL